MKIKYFGTAAAEGVPALFCKCKVCKEARRRGGRDIRTRSQALINDELLLDFPGDSYFHFLHYNYPLADIEHLFVTHGHGDHFYPEDLTMRMAGYSNGLDAKLTVYGNKRVEQFYERALALEGFKDEKHLDFKRINPFESFKVKSYEVVPLLADHDKRETCLIYQLSEQNKTMLYAHDTGYLVKENWKYWEQTTPYFHFVSLDCNHQNKRVTGNHMSFYDNVAIKERMIEMGLADDATIFVCNHFSHNSGLLYDEMNFLAQKESFLVAYDGLELDF